MDGDDMGLEQQSFLIDIGIMLVSCVAVYSFGNQRRFVMAACISIGCLPVAFHAGLMFQYLNSY